MDEFEIIDQTDEYLVINKPANLAVEPPSHKITLAELLVKNDIINPTDWQEGERLGVVHRLDTDTSGVMLWAKNSEAKEKLKLLWQGRQVKKTYLALVLGETDTSGEIDLPISRDNKNDRQQVDWLKTDRSRPALTSYERLGIGEYQGKKVSLVRAHPITGRTHQIRVHFKAINHPLIGDELYGEKATREISEGLELNRQFLHAETLELPDGKKYCATLPDELLACLKKVKIELPSAV